MRTLLAMVGAAVIAFLVGRRHPSPVRFVPRGRVGELERRLMELEGAGADLSGEQIGKLYAALHYETLATELARERQIADLDGRLREIERTRQLSPVVWAASRRNGTVSGERRDG